MPVRDLKKGVLKYSFFLLLWLLRQFARIAVIAVVVRATGTKLAEVKDFSASIACFAALSFLFCQMFVLCI